MEKEMSAWNTTCKRFVAFLDIMGFKDMVFRNNHQEVYELLKSFQPTIGEIEEHARQILSGKLALNIEGTSRHRSIIRPILFSDSIILISNDDSLLSAFYLLNRARWLLYQAIVKGIPLKGAIAYGEQTADFDKSLHFGRPLIDAFELQNDLLLYGVILHHTMEKSLIEIDKNEVIRTALLHNCHVDMKNGKITHYILDWIPFCAEKENPINLVSEMYKSVSGTPRIYVDNTLKYVRKVTKQKAELKQKK